MPDVNNALKFQKKLISVEATYLRQIKAYRSETRRALLEIIQRDGVSRPAVSQMVTQIGDLSRRITSAGSFAARDIRHHVNNYTRKQIQLAKRAGLIDSADISPIINAGTQIAQDGEESYLTSQSAWLAQLETSLQVQAAKLRISNATPDEIADRLLSDSMADGRASVWLANENQEKSEEVNNVWAYGIGLLGAYLALFDQSQPETKYMKQVIATIDERTTDCCLRAHGQIQPIDEPFHLTGEPRYADEIQDPPFHWYCRSSVVLYHESFEDFGIPTSQMVDAARAELTAREETKKRVKIYPSHATARRR